MQNFVNNSPKESKCDPPHPPPPPPQQNKAMRASGSSLTPGGSRGEERLAGRD